MKLKTLELQGFKSFPDKTVISFDKGITVIVGPNGSGKSNISDAMRWVLGEMSTKSIRGQKMEDVIFAGSQKRSPMGYAEVTVTFDNSGDDGERLESMAEYDEISVSRRYYRAGESEYFINRKKVRLRDVHELFMNTGLGKGGYSIIGQGKIAEIISQKNEERRAVFEEAAGISKYRYQKADAMRKLEQTNTNLSGAEIVLSELEGRVEPLRKEAEKAKKYLEIYEAKKALDISLSLFDIDEAKKKVDDIETKTAGAKAELDSIDETTAALETKYNSTYEALMRSKADSEQNIILSGDADAKAKAAEAEIRIAKTSNEHYAEMSSAAKQKFDDESKLYKEAEAEYNGTKKELDAAEGEKRKIADKIAECDAEEAEKNSDAQGIDSQIREIGELIEAAKATEIETKVAISVAVAQKSSSANKSDELEAEIKKHGDDIAMFESRIKKAEEKIADYDKKADDIKTKLDGIDARKAETANKQAKLGERKNTLFLDISQRRHRVQNLVRMDELLDGYSSAVRFVMNENSADKISGAKICGPVSKLIEVDPKYATALEVAFGAML
ncbi:MAG: AAA family ATPase, partial [Clostridiales bacterium]|nr:AAA family ATPase [Clostridiales bacterium]